MQIRERETIGSTDLRDVKEFKESKEHKDPRTDGTLTAQSTDRDTATNFLAKTQVVKDNLKSLKQKNSTLFSSITTGGEGSKKKSLVGRILRKKVSREDVAWNSGPKITRDPIGRKKSKHAVKPIPAAVMTTNTQENIATNNTKKKPSKTTFKLNFESLN